MTWSLCHRTWFVFFFKSYFFICYNLEKNSRNFLLLKVTNLRKALRNRPALLGDGVSRAFLRALVQLTAGYREALTLQQGERITFDPNKFVESRPLSMQPFLRKMLELQIFQQVSFHCLKKHKKIKLSY